MLRQKVISGYIVDFFVPRIRLVIEIDGSFHNGRDEYDQYRTSVFKKRGNWVLRLTNEEVLASTAEQLKEQVTRAWSKRLLDKRR